MTKPNAIVFGMRTAERKEYDRLWNERNREKVRAYREATKDKRNARRRELYDLEADRSEMNNLAPANAGKVSELQGKWEAWAARAGVADWALVTKS